MDLILRLKLRNRVVEKSNEGIKFASYDRVLQKRRKDAFVHPIGKKVNGCLCKTKVI